MTRQERAQCGQRQRERSQPAFPWRFPPPTLSPIRTSTPATATRCATDRVRHELGAGMTPPCEPRPRDPRRVRPSSPPRRPSPPPGLLADRPSPPRFLSPAPAPRGRGQQLRLLPAHSDRRAGRNGTEPPPLTSIDVLVVRLLLEPTRLLGLAARLVARDTHPARHPLPGQQPVGAREQRVSVAVVTPRGSGARSCACAPAPPTVPRGRST